MVCWSHALEPTSMMEERGEGEMFPNRQEAELKKGSVRGGIVPSSNLQASAFFHEDLFSKFPPSYNGASI